MRLTTQGHKLKSGSNKLQNIDCQQWIELIKLHIRFRWTLSAEGASMLINKTVLKLIYKSQFFQSQAFTLVLIY